MQMSPIDTFRWVIYSLLIIGFVWIIYKSCIVETFEGQSAGSEYNIQEVPEFLTPQECATIIQLATPNLDKSNVYLSTGDKQDTSIRESEQCWLKDQDHPLIRAISERVAALTKTDINNQEELQVVKYEPGGFYLPHFDACDKKVDDCTNFNGDRGERFLTVIMYLNNDFEGGETEFPYVPTKIVPQCGKAAVFVNMDSSGNVLYKSRHGGNEVKSGQKWIATKWIRSQDLQKDLSIR
jgi:prolyl 4-hydroxylase